MAIIIGTNDYVGGNPGGIFNPNNYDDNVDDTLTGGDEGDIIIGLGGNDNLNGAGGNDLVAGGEGNDKVAGGKGDNLLLGDGFPGDGEGKDTLNGKKGNGNNIMVGGGGKDKFLVGTGDNVIEDWEVGEKIVYNSNRKAGKDKDGEVLRQGEGVLTQEGDDVLITFDNGTTLVKNAQVEDVLGSLKNKYKPSTSLAQQAAPSGGDEGPNYVAYDYVTWNTDLDEAVVEELRADIERLGAYYWITTEEGDVQNPLVGTEEGDVLTDSLTNDLMKGRGGADVFQVSAGLDVILDFTYGEDAIDILGGVQGVYETEVGRLVEHDGGYLHVLGDFTELQIVSSLI